MWRGGLNILGFPWNIVLGSFRNDCFCWIFRSFALTRNEWKLKDLTRRNRLSKLGVRPEVWGAGFLRIVPKVAIPPGKTFAAWLGCTSTETFKIAVLSALFSCLMKPILVEISFTVHLQLFCKPEKMGKRKIGRFRNKGFRIVFLTFS